MSPHYRELLFIFRLRNPFSSTNLNDYSLRRGEIAFFFFTIFAFELRVSPPPRSIRGRFTRGRILGAKGNTGGPSRGLLYISTYFTKINVCLFFNTDWNFFVFFDYIVRLPMRNIRRGRRNRVRRGFVKRCSEQRRNKHLNKRLFCTRDK